MAINVLAIIFSIFFASLAVIMASPDNQFIRFIEKPKMLFSKLIRFFRFTLFALFIALLCTIVIYIYTACLSETSPANRPIFLVFIAMFTYSLIATILGVDVALRITSNRAEFIANQKDDKNNEEEAK